MNERARAYYRKYEKTAKRKAYRRKWDKARYLRRKHDSTYQSKFRAYQKQWVSANRERLKKYQAQWQKENRDKSNAYTAKWRKKNRRDYLKQQMNYNTSKNRKISYKEYLLKHPSKRRLDNHKRRIKIYKNGGTLSQAEWLEIRNRSPMCAACGRFVGCENLTIDHIIPLSKGGKHSKENIQALCFSCNAKKNDFTPWVY